MTRESCIAHPPKQAISIVRQDYYELTGRDACAAALLNIFEYWANAALATDASIERPWVGARPIREFERLLLGIATDKQIRKRLALLEASGFIHTRPPAKRGAAKEYQVRVTEIQQAISQQVLDSGLSLRSFDPSAIGQITEDVQLPRSNDRLASGQITQASSVKQPVLRRSFDPALKKISKDSRKEDLKKEDLKKEDLRKEDLKEKTISFSDLKKSVEHRASSTSASESVQVGAIRYAQPPESIDLAELWECDPQQAKRQIQDLAPAHKRPEMVAHGLGHWWVGPGLNDFDPHLIQACQNRKRKFQQSDSIGDAKTYINNMLRNGDWGNFALRCEEAQLLRDRAVALPVTRAIEPTATAGRSPFERSDAERRASALGLARFKVASGDIEQALAISEQFGLSSAELGLVDERLLPALKLNAA